ncbi:MAG TPA: hypothetical protein VK212_01710 [Lentimicrobium sp.]|nr:hypothetical protein [Lentimicrobium sp.]
MHKLVLVLISIALYSHSGFTQTLQPGKSVLPAFAVKYNTEEFGRNVFIFDPGMDRNEMQTLIDSLYNQQHPRSSEFGDNRYALLFKPGTYQLDIKVGYYTSIVGLGETPEEVVIRGILLSKGEQNGNVTCNFWRSVENITFESPAGKLNIWGVSQAAPMRRAHIKGSIQLHDNGWASGGFLADSKVDDTIFAGGQQQWFTRNVDLGQWERGSWNMMFMGVPNAPEDKWPENPYTVIDNTPMVREKPYLVIQGSEYLLKLPQIKKNSSGISWQNKYFNEEVYPLEDFYIVNPITDNAVTLNSALSKGKNLFFLPGIYVMDETLKINRTGTIVMGIGMATLRSGSGKPVFEIADVDGVTLSGLIIDAGAIESETLVRVGETNSGMNHEGNPSVLSDIFFRVGGYGEGKSASCMIINSNDVIVDHTWIWRADHGKNVGWDQNTTKNGLIVNGDNVTVYGLFCEHFHEYQTLWNGDGGKVYFYQSEMPYDPPTAEAFRHGTINGYASYKVADEVKSHEAWALGIYCVFFKAPVIVDQAIETPPQLGKDIHHKIIYWLYGGNKESKILSVINGKGGHVDFNTVKTVMD